MKRLGFHTLRDKATDTLGDKLSRQLQEDVAPKMSDEEAFSFAGFNAEDAERGGYSDYSYWKSTLRAFFQNKIAVFFLFVMVAVLLFTSQTYGEVPVLLLTFVIAMILNQGTNFLLGKISFVSNSVTSILQLALSLDYAVILCNHFKEQRETMPVREAAIAVLSRAIPEISASSLTTVGGLAAMLFMQFKIGPDMGICLIKATIFTASP